MHALMITNGSLIGELAKNIVEAGLDELNVSLDGATGIKLIGGANTTIQNSTIITQGVNVEAVLLRGLTRQRMHLQQKASVSMSQYYFRIYPVIPL